MFGVRVRAERNLNFSKEERFYRNRGNIPERFEIRAIGIQSHLFKL